MAYTFEQLLAADPSNPSNIAQNGSITIFAPGDATMTPLAITDPDGSPLANPFTVNANGFGPAFAHATLDRVAWSGGGFTGFHTSYEGMKEEAVAARAAAESASSEAANAANNAAAAATASLNTAVFAAETSADDAAAAQASALAAQAAAEASAAASGGGGIGLDPADPDTIIMSTKADGSVTVDPTDSDAILITL